MIPPLWRRRLELRPSNSTLDNIHSTNKILRSYPIPGPKATHSFRRGPLKQQRRTSPLEIVRPKHGTGEICKRGGNVQR